MSQLSTPFSNAH